MKQISSIIGVFVVDFFHLGLGSGWWLFFLNLDSLDLFWWKGWFPIASFINRVEDIGDFGDRLMYFFDENILLR